MRYLLSAVLCLCLTNEVMAATRYVSLTGSDANSCTASEDITTPKRTLDQATDCLAPGDTMYIRGGTWNERINLQDKGKSGTAVGWITIAGYPGETVILRYTDTGSYGAIKARGNRGYFIFENLIIDGVNYSGTETIWAIRDGGHHFTLRKIEIKNTHASALYIGGNDIEITDSYFHDTVSPTCATGSRYYGIYMHDGSRITLKRNTFEQNPGGGLQAYPGPLTDIVISDNVMRFNGSCPLTNHGGMVLSSDSTGTGGGSITNVTISGNVIYSNGQAGYGGAGTGGNTGGTGHGIRVSYSFPTGSMSGVKINNNTIYNNFGGSTKAAYGIAIQSGGNNIEVKNNIVLNNEDGQISNGGSGNTITHNICKVADSCGTTGKVTVTAITDVTISTSDFRLKQGANVARDAGTSVTTRPSPIGVTDIGAYEQGVVSSASVVSGFIELPLSLMTPGAVPVSGITAVTVACVGCTGTPVATPTVKSGTTATLQIFLSGLTGNGSCTVSVGATNLTDSLYVGGLVGTAQGINSVSGMSVTGTCQNTAGAGGGGGGLYSRFLLAEGSGTVATDDSGGAHNGTVSAGVTWVSSGADTGVTIPTDTTFRSIASTYGSGVNPTTQGFGACVTVTPDVTQAQKIVLSAGGNGASQRWYAGWATVGGQLQWGVGAQASGFASTGSEFVVTSAKTFVCLITDSTADTVTLWINGVKGTQVGKSVKSVTSYTLVGNIIAGNDGTFTTNNGGYTIYEMWVWNTTPADSDITTLFTSLTPTGTTPCLAQTFVQAELMDTTSGGSPIVYPMDPDGSYHVVANGGIALKIQYTCTGSAGATISTRAHYSTDNSSFFLVIPDVLGDANISMWGVDSDVYLNKGVSSGCINATGLTPNSGVTMSTSSASPTFALAQNHCRTDRYLIRVGNIPNQTRWIRIYTDAGDSFANGYSQDIKLTITPVVANGG